ncbi:MAG: hypothetical protein JNM27_11125 [Leptospirales bacterium]|nr:hypothetical protein [Leptospirales bacterium]
MNYGFLRNYSEYRDHNDRTAGEQFASNMHRLLGIWAERGRPEEEFVDQFQEFMEDLQTVPPDQNDLLDLGIMHALEAVNLHKEGRPDEALRIASEARFPFLAYLDEDSYRHTTSVVFHEIDFQIYERIQGNFPHEAARNFLLNIKRTDLWAAIRYLEGLENRADAIELLGNMMQRRTVLPERLILLAFWVLLDPDLLTSEGKPSFEEEGLVESISRVARPEMAVEGLDASWAERLDPVFESEILFFMQAYFEISGSPLSPGWVCLLEKSIANHWRVVVPDFPDEVHEPNPEFAGSILHLLEDEQLESLLKTSLILPLFMEHMERYVDFSFYEISSGLSRMEDVFLEELTHSLERLVASEVSDLLRSRLEESAELLSCSLVNESNHLVIRRKHI